MFQNIRGISDFSRFKENYLFDDFIVIIACENDNEILISKIFTGDKMSVTPLGWIVLIDAENVIYACPLLE